VLKPLAFVLPLGLDSFAIVGVAPAIANAVFHATGQRIRSVPITVGQPL